MNVIAAMSGMQWFMCLAIIVVCCVLMLVILIQRGRGGGLSGAFGGGGGSAAFGAKTGDVFTWITVGMAFLFLLLAVVGGFVFDKSLPTAAESQVEPGDDAETTEPTETTGPITIGPETIDLDMAPAGDKAPAAPAGGEPAETGGAAVPIKVEPAGSGPDTPAPAAADPAPKPAETPAGADAAGAEPETGAADNSEGEG